MNLVKRIMKVSEEKLQKMLRAIAHAMYEFADSLGEEKTEESIEQLKSHLEQERKKVAELEIKNADYKLRNEEFQELKKRNAEMEERLLEQSVLEEQFREIVKTMKVVEELPDKVKMELKNLLGEATPEDIVGCGLRLSNLQNFWEVARMHAVNGELEIARKLGKIFSYMISIFPKTNANAQKVEVSVGDQFDDKMHLHCEGKSRVMVQEVLVDGLMLNGDVKLQAIVR